MEKRLCGIIAAPHVLISVQVGQQTRVRTQPENITFHAAPRVAGKDGARMIAEIVERAWSTSPPDMPCSGAEATRHWVFAVSAERAVDEKMVRHSFHSFRQFDQAVFIQAPLGVKGKLPEMPVGVGEITVIAAPKGLGRLLQDFCAPAALALAITASISPSLATFCATAMPPLP